MLIIRQIALLCLVTLKKYFRTITFVFRSILNVALARADRLSFPVFFLRFDDASEVQLGDRKPLGDRTLLGQCGCGQAPAAAGQREAAPPGLCERRLDRLSFFFYSDRLSFLFFILCSQLSNSGRVGAIEAARCGVMRPRHAWGGCVRRLASHIES